jgi:hypothetical protein
MGLLSTDISKVKKLSLKDAKLPAPKIRIENNTFVNVEKPPTNEEVFYNKLIAVNPLLEELVETFNLVSINTGERIKKVDLKTDNKPHPEPEVKVKEIDKPKLIALAQRVIDKENNYSKEDLVNRIINITNVNQERADKGFNLMLEAGAIQYTKVDTYYLTGSTPF